MNIVCAQGIQPQQREYAKCKLAFGKTAIHVRVRRIKLNGAVDVYNSVALMMRRFETAVVREPLNISATRSNDTHGTRVYTSLG